MRIMFRAIMFAVLVALASSSSSYAVLGEREDAVNNVKEYAVAIDTGSADTDSYKYDGWMTITGLNNFDEGSRMAFILFLENMRLLSQGENYQNKPEYKKFQKIIELFSISRKRNWTISVRFHSDANPGGTSWNDNYKKVNVNTYGKEFLKIIRSFIFEICNSINYGANQKKSVQGSGESHGVMTEILETGSVGFLNHVTKGINQTDLKVIHNALQNEQNFLNPTEQQLIQDALTTWENEVQKKQLIPYDIVNNLEIQWKMGHTREYIDRRNKLNKYYPIVRKRLEDNDPDNEENTEKARQYGRKLIGLLPLSNVAAPELKKAADEAKRYFYQPTHRKDDLEYIKRNEKLDQLIPSDIRLLQIRMDEIKRHAENVNDLNFFLAMQKFLDNIRWALSRDPEKNITMQDLEDLKTHYETDGLDTLLRDNDAGMKGVIAREALEMPAPKPEEKVQDLTKGIEDRISEIQKKLGEGGAKNFADFMNTFFNKTYTAEEKKILMRNGLWAFLEKLGAIKNMTAMDITENVTRNIEKLITFMKALRSGNVVRASEKLMAEIENLMNAVVGYVEKYKKGEMDEEELKKLKNKFKDLLGDNGIFVSERIGDREGKSIVQTLIEKWIPQETKNLNDEERGVLNVKMDQARQRIDEMLARPDVVHFVRLLSGDTVNITQKLDKVAHKTFGLRNKMIEKKDDIEKKEREFHEIQKDLQKKKARAVTLKKVARWLPVDAIRRFVENNFGWVDPVKDLEEKNSAIQRDISKIEKEKEDLYKDVLEKTKETKASMAFENQASVMSFFIKVLRENISENALKNFTNLLEDLEKPGNEHTKRIFYSILRTYIFLSYRTYVTSASLIGVDLNEPSKRFREVLRELEKQFESPLGAADIKGMMKKVGLSALQVSVLEEKAVAEKLETQQKDLSIKSIMDALNTAIMIHEKEL